MATDTLTGLVKFHLSINVSNLARSIAFYEILFDRPPAKRRPDYAKFEAEEPPLVLSLNPTGHSPGGVLNHMGIRLNDAAALVDCQRRFEAAGISTQREDGVACCYARQTKFWVSDPDKNLWELYILHEDLDERGEGHVPGELPAGQVVHGSTGSAASPQQSLQPSSLKPQASSLTEPVVWQHIIMQPVPDRIDHADSSVDEVRLEGAFNLQLDPTVRSKFLSEIIRVLRPGGKVQVHGLVSKSRLAGRPSLPGPAALVEYVPLENEPLEALTAAGFTAAELTKLGEAPCFVLGGVEMRELMLVARKPVPARGAASQVVMYRGPCEQIVDGGKVFPRGQRVTVDAGMAENLRRGPAADSFVFLTSDGLPVHSCGL